MTAPLPQSEADLLKQMDEDISILVLVQGTLPDGSAHYAYASIPPSRYAALKVAEAKGNYNLAAFGKILAHGAEKNPPPEVRERMVKQYGINHRFEEDLERWMDELRHLKANAGSAGA